MIVSLNFEPVTSSSPAPAFTVTPLTPFLSKAVVMSLASITSDNHLPEYTPFLLNSPPANTKSFKSTNSATSFNFSFTLPFEPTTSLEAKFFNVTDSESLNVKTTSFPTMFALKSEWVWQSIVRFSSFVRFTISLPKPASELITFASVIILSPLPPVIISLPPPA